MKKLFLVITGFALIASLGSCVAKRKLIDSQLQARQLQGDSAMLANRVSNLQDQLSDLNSKNSNLKNDIDNLNGQVASLSHNNSSKQGQLEMSQKALKDQQAKLQHLQDLLDAQKQKSNELRQKMADALAGFNSNELTVTQKNGKVYVSMQESLLFPSGSAVVSKKGIDALAKLAAVLNTNPDIQIDVEGHTDSIPIRGRFQDNWELSTARANSIVRILIDRYRVSPLNLIASGHSQYDPVDTNATPEGRAKNRRTDIILSPKLDELYKIINN
ncbi:OmpA family protein [Arachidicoccus sp.]|uniref:OmpA/MotB family protein n=1 Tax=Arachidicoccus sp. TaxID=1872624 RepID=UPI003D1DD4DA